MMICNAVLSIWILWGLYRFADDSDVVDSVDGPQVSVEKNISVSGYRQKDLDVSGPEQHIG